MKRLATAAFVLALAGCASQPKAPEPAPAATARADASTPKQSPYAPAKEDLSKRGNYTAGGLYAPGVKDSAPDVDIDVSLIPEPDVVALPRSRYGNRSTYKVLGKSYHVMDDAGDYVERGTASYYGKKFHGRRTSNMEVYDMYAFTAAHKTLPLPSFARVTNLDNGESVVVRVNDRGPFHEGRIIDLSYAAAVKLGITRAGTGRVEVRALLPGEPVQPLVADADGDDVVDTRVASADAPSTSMDQLVAALPAAATPEAGNVVLQVASFSGRANADRALTLLRQAGIDQARLQDASSDGRQIWRLQVGPLAADAVGSLTGRISGLGFGTPQQVHE